MNPVILLDTNDRTRGDLVAMFAGGRWRLLAFDHWRAAREAMRARPPVAVVLTDWRSFGGRGSYRRLRYAARGAPFIMVCDGGVTEWDERFAKVVHYPVSREELLAAVAAAVEAHRTWVAYGGYRLDQAAQSLQHGKRSVHLTGLQTKLLASLLQAQGEPVPSSDLAEAMWPGQGEHDRRLLYTHIAWLRRRLTAAGLAVAIESVRPRGYRFVNHPETTPPDVRAGG